MQNIVMCVLCLFVCLLKYRAKPHGQISANFLCMLIVIITRLSSADFVIGDVLPVLFGIMFSHFHVMVYGLLCVL